MMQKLLRRPANLTAVLVVSAIAAALGVPKAGAFEPAERIIVAQAAEKASGEGVVKGVNAAERKVRIAHEPIPALKWPAMTMAFSLSPNADLTVLAEGAKVKFTLSRDAKGMWVIDEIRRAE